jgi:hypothetical protein
MQNKYYYYQWVPCYAPLMLLAAIGAHALLYAEMRSYASLYIAVAAALMLMAQVCALPFYDVSKFIYYFVIKRNPDLYYASFQFVPDGGVAGRTYNVAAEMMAARYIAEHTKPDDGVFVWGNDASVRYLADRPNPTRFTYEIPLSLDGPYRAAYRSEAMEALRARPPVYFVVGLNWWAADTKAQSLSKFPELAAFLSRGYHLERSIGGLDLYRRNSAIEPPPSSVRGRR